MSRVARTSFALFGFYLLDKRSILKELAKIYFLGDTSAKTPGNWGSHSPILFGKEVRVNLDPVPPETWIRAPAEGGGRPPFNTAREMRRNPPQPHPPGPDPSQCRLLKKYIRKQKTPYAAPEKRPPAGQNDLREAKIAL